jgi:uncharacterized protein (TIGR03435 family)
MRWLIVLMFALTAQAQKFEVATIKPCRRDGDTRTTIGPPTPGHLTLNCFSAALLIRQSYVLFANGRLTAAGRIVPIEKGPAWIESELYTIEAKAAGPADQGTMRGPMMRALLEDRFQLKLHTETREEPVYLLTVAKDGPKLKAAPPGSCVAVDIDHLPAPSPQPPQFCGIDRVTHNGFDIRGATMPEFSQALAGRLDREVVDRTGITGLFDFEFDMFPDASSATLGPAPNPGGPPPPPAPPPPPGPNGLTDPGGPFVVTQAALQKFGLRLESAKGPVRFLVIDRVERPSEN